jgi:hypothetical protein
MESYGGGNSVKSLSRCGSEMNKMTPRSAGIGITDSKTFGQGEAFGVKGRLGIAA